MRTQLAFAIWDSYLTAFREACIRENHICAEKILCHALADAEEFGELDPSIVWSGHSLAAFYRINGKPGRAAEVYWWILEAQEKTLGPDHPDVAASLERVAADQLDAQAKALAIA